MLQQGVRVKRLSLDTDAKLSFDYQVSQLYKKPGINYVLLQEL